MKRDERNAENSDKRKWDEWFRKAVSVSLIVFKDDGKGRNGSSSLREKGAEYEQKLLEFLKFKRNVLFENYKGCCHNVP